jgi:putative peptidoglycan lipid II flippase
LFSRWQPFSRPRHAAAWGVLVAGVLEFLLVAGDASLAVCWRDFAGPNSMRRTAIFPCAWPSIVGSAGVQLAIRRHDHRKLPSGAFCSLLCVAESVAVGVIGIAAGTVILPEMSRESRAGRSPRAARASRAIESTLLLSIPASRHSSSSNLTMRACTRRLHRRRC